MKSPTFEILTPLKGLNILSKSIADADLLKPTQTANYLVGGEWLVLDGSDKAERPSADPSTGEVGPYVFFSDPGRSDTQASGKVPLVMTGDYVARTKLFTGNPTAGQSLEVTQAAYDGQNRSVLQAQTTGKTVAYVMEAQDSDGWLKIKVSAA